MATTQLECQFTGCEWKVEHTSEAVAIALLTSHGNVHTHGRGPTDARMKQPKVDRPELLQDISDEDWETYEEEWRRFKRSWYTTSTTQMEVTDQLLQCCEQNLRRLLVKQDPEISSQPEHDVLKAIREMAVIKIAASVRRTKLMLSRQDHGVNFREYYANTRAAAATCNYKIQCRHDCCAEKDPIDYTQNVVKDIILAGMADSDIRRDVLGLSDLDSKTAKDIVAIVEEKEVASDACLDPLNGNAAGLSAYRNRSRQPDRSNKGMLKAQLAMRGNCEQCTGDMALYTRFSSGRLNAKPFKLCSSCFKASKGNRNKRDSDNAAETNAVNSFIRVVCSEFSGNGKDVDTSGIILDHHIFTEGE